MYVLTQAHKSIGSTLGSFGLESPLFLVIYVTFHHIWLLTMDDIVGRRVQRRYILVRGAQKLIRKAPRDQI